MLNSTPRNFRAHPPMMVPTYGGLPSDPRPTDFFLPPPPPSGTRPITVSRSRLPRRKEEKGGGGGRDEKRRRQRRSSMKTTQKLRHAEIKRNSFLNSNKFFSVFTIRFRRGGRTKGIDETLHLDKQTVLPLLPFFPE